MSAIQGVPLEERPPRPVTLSCGHGLLFKPPVPKSGEALLCLICDDYKTVGPQVQRITWAEIEAESGDIVAVFHKYEGQLTDEEDERGSVTVTVASFARHLGISRGTFRGWVESTPSANTAKWRRVAVKA